MGELVATNIRETIALYWEADRSTVKARYNALFPPNNEETAEEIPASSATEPEQPEAKAIEQSEDWEAYWDITFRNIVDDVRLSDPVRQELLKAWDGIEPIYRPVVIHHLCVVGESRWTLGYAMEGLINDFGAWIATHALHAISPELVFPIDKIPSHRRLKAIFRILGIDYDDDEGSSATTVAQSISQAVHDFNQQNGWEPWQTWAMVYNLGPRLLPDPEPYPTDRPPRVWIISGNEPGGDFEASDKHLNSEVYDWCINSKAQRGDLALLYHLAPRSAIVSVYRCFSDAYQDPLEPRPWSGGRVESADRIAIPWMTLNDMRNDPMLKTWGLVRRSFQGMLQSEVPADVWNRLKELVAQKDAEAGQFLDRYAAAAGGVHSIPAVGEEVSEKEVEDALVLPLLQALGWDPKMNLSRQYEMNIKIGSGRPKRVRADFVGFRDALGSEALMVLETKCRIRTDAELSSAVEQCESYAGKLRCPRFAVAAPEGLWAYQMNFPGYSTLSAHVELQREISTLTMQKLSPLLAYKSLAARSDVVPQP